MSVEENTPHRRSSSASFAQNMSRDFPQPNSAAAFAGARSPPKAKNTSHVPCKFYPFGTCQAGAACQFSHDMDPMTQNAPCKYFAKGSCRFGQGCALAHILPDGRVINRPPRGGQPFNYGRRGPQPYAPAPPSLLTMQANDLASQQQQQPQEMGYPKQEDVPNIPNPAPYLQASQPLSLDPSNTFGSPLNDNRFGASPNARGLSVLDAPLPGSFDSQGISHAARHGPFASSVPPRLGHGLESPPSSLPNKAFLGSTLRGLGDTTLDGVLAGSSPPTFEEPMSFGKRPLHSERFSRPRPMMSASVGTRPSFYSHFPPDATDSEESEEEGIGEDLLPSSLHELLPPEKLRRPSQQIDDDINPSFLSAGRRAISNGQIPVDNKVGSISPHTGSPSRYSSIWSSGSYRKEGENGFGHIGSPLRPSSLRSSSLAGGDLGSLIGSPPKQASMSMLTRELQSTRISEKSPSLLPRTSSNDSRAALRGGLDRGISSNSLGRNETIEEEDQGLFSMEEEDEFESSSKKPSVSPIGLLPGKSETTLGPIGGQRTK
ncbi:hypothetical protein KCV04_g15254, partial [Aureobasidium melanogenum]